MEPCWGAAVIGVTDPQITTLRHDGQARLPLSVEANYRVVLLVPNRYFLDVIGYELWSLAEAVKRLEKTGSRDAC